MALILHIDTATGQAVVSIASDGNLLQQRVNSRAMDHATWIHTAIRELADEGSIVTLQDIEAVAVVAGPGSYTGLRVGMATAKGLAYALNVPLVSLNTLKLMAFALRRDAPPSSLLCPMLDARRLEVFTGLYDSHLQELVPPSAMILREDSFSNWLETKPIIFSGDGSVKWKAMLHHANASFTDSFYTARDIAVMAEQVFQEGEFADLAYADPIYLKEFYSYQKQ